MESVPNLAQTDKGFDTPPSGSVYDLEFLSDRLSGKLDNLHREGSRLRSACPNCGGSRRFYTGPTVNFGVWNCHSCGRTVTTAALLGVAFVTAPRPAVKEWQDDTPDPDRLTAIRGLYRSLTDYAVAALADKPKAQNYLTDRGLTPDAIRDAQLGFLNGKLYRLWYRELTPEERAAIPWAGLPEVNGPRFSGFSAMFAAGYQGKVVLPYFDEDGQVVDLRTRSISPEDTVGGKPVRYVGPKGGYADRGALVPYGVDTLDDGNRVILTEGEFKRPVPTGIRQWDQPPVLTWTADLGLGAHSIISTMDTIMWSLVDTDSSTRIEAACTDRGLMKQFYTLLDVARGLAETRQMEGGQPEPDPPKPGDGATWDDVFDWYYRVGRELCPTIKDLAKKINMAEGTVYNHHSNYKARYGEQPMK